MPSVTVAWILAERSLGGRGCKGQRAGFGGWELLFTFLNMALYIYIYIYAFSRRFYPKRLTLHSSYSFTFYQLLLSLGIEPMILALPAPCSTI